jgi:hypothetical protein
MIPMPIISLQPISPRVEASFDKDGLPQFPPNSPHGATPLPARTPPPLFVLSSPFSFYPLIN